MKSKDKFWKEMEDRASEWKEELEKFESLRAAGDKILKDMHDVHNLIVKLDKQEDIQVMSDKTIKILENYMRKYAGKHKILFGSKEPKEEYELEGIIDQYIALLRRLIRKPGGINPKKLEEWMDEAEHLIQRLTAQMNEEEAGRDTAEDWMAAKDQLTDMISKGENHHDKAPEEKKEEVKNLGTRLVEVINRIGGMLEGANARFKKRLGEWVKQRRTINQEIAATQDLEASGEMEGKIDWSPIIGRLEKLKESAEAMQERAKSIMTKPKFNIMDEMLKNAIKKIDDLITEIKEHAKDPSKPIALLGEGETETPTGAKGLPGGPPAEYTQFIEDTNKVTEDSKAQLSKVRLLSSEHLSEWKSLNTRLTALEAKEAGLRTQLHNIETMSPARKDELIKSVEQRVALMKRLRELIQVIIEAIDKDEAEKIYEEATPTDNKILEDLRSRKNTLGHFLKDYQDIDMKNVAELRELHKKIISERTGISKLISDARKQSKHFSEKEWWSVAGPALNIDTLLRNLGFTISDRIAALSKTDMDTFIRERTLKMSAFISDELLKELGMAPEDSKKKVKDANDIEKERIEKLTTEAKEFQEKLMIDMLKDHDYLGFPKKANREFMNIALATIMGSQALGLIETGQDKDRIKSRYPDGVLANSEMTQKVLKGLLYEFERFSTGNGFKITPEEYKKIIETATDLLAKKKDHFTVKVDGKAVQWPVHALKIMFSAREAEYGMLKDALQKRIAENEGVGANFHEVYKDLEKKHAEAKSWLQYTDRTIKVLAGWEDRIRDLCVEMADWKKPLTFSGKKSDDYSVDYSKFDRIVSDFNAVLKQYADRVPDYLKKFTEAAEALANWRPELYSRIVMAGMLRYESVSMIWNTFVVNLVPLKELNETLAQDQTRKMNVVHRQISQPKTLRFQLPEDMYRKDTSDPDLNKTNTEGWNEKSVKLAKTDKDLALKLFEDATKK